MWKIMNKAVQISISPVVGTAAIFVAFLIHKFKNLETTTNLYLKHYAIANIIFYIAKPTLGFVISILSSDPQFLNSCIVFNTDVFLLTLPLLFGFLLGFEYILACYLDSYCEWSRKWQRFIIFVVYFMYFIEFLTVKITCICTFEVSDVKAANVIAIVLVVFKLSLHVTRHFLKPPRNCRSLKYAWKISNIIVYSWIPSILFYFPYVLEISDINRSRRYFLFLINLVLIVCQYVPQFIIAVTLQSLHKHFNSAVSKLFQTSNRLFFQQNISEETDRTSDSTEQFDNEYLYL